MLKLVQLVEGYSDEVKDTVKDMIRVKAKRSYQNYLDKVGDTSNLPKQDATNPEWRQAVIDAIEGKEVVQDPSWTHDPVEFADKKLHQSFMTWLKVDL